MLDLSPRAAADPHSAVTGHDDDDDDDADELHLDTTRRRPATPVDRFSVNTRSPVARQ